MSKFAKSIGALAVVILIFLATSALRSLQDARAEALNKTLTPCVPVLVTDPGRGVPSAVDITILAIKAVKTQGALSPAAVRKTLTADLARLADCCWEATRNDVPLPRKITLVFKVGPDGRLAGEPLGKPPLANQKFEDHMAAAFRTLQFPAFQGAPEQVEVTLALAG